MFTPLKNELATPIATGSAYKSQTKTSSVFDEYLQQKAVSSQSPLLSRGKLTRLDKSLDSSLYPQNSSFGSGASPYLRDHFASPSITSYGRPSRKAVYNGNTTSTGRSANTGSVNPVTPIQQGEYTYQAQKVGEIDRAPMAMFEHNGELLISAITRNGISETPVWSYTDENGVQKRAKLPEQAESGHYGFSSGGEFHIVPESNNGMIDYTAKTPEGPYTKNDYSHLNPHEYKNLKWGYAYKSPETGQEFMGFGNADHPGVVINYNKDTQKWETFAAPEDMRFPTGMGVINSGENKGTTLISSATYGRSMIHAVAPDGTTTKIKDFGDWGLLRTDPNEQVAYMTVGNGKVYWASFDDLNNWKECKYEKPSGMVDHVETGLGEPAIHPDTGRMVFNALDMKNGNTAFYEAQRSGDDIVLKEVLFLKGVGQWAGKTAQAGGDLYFGSGVATGKSADSTHGAIYRLTATKTA